MCQWHFVWWMSDEDCSSSGKNTRSHLIRIYTVEVHYVLESLRVFYHCNAYNIWKFFTYEGITEAEYKLGVIFKKVYQVPSYFFFIQLSSHVLLKDKAFSTTVMQIIPKFISLLKALLRLKIYLVLISINLVK